MIKVGIITIIDYDNYGNRLQNVATHTILRSFGYDPMTIINSPNIKGNLLGKIKKTRFKILRSYLKKIIILLRRRIYPNKNDKQLAILAPIREKNFREFSSRYLTETKQLYNLTNIETIDNKNYYAFLVGSDQVWNPNYRGGSSLDFLTFAPKEKRIAYAASFGISEIPQEYRENYQKWLSEMAHISVREDSGAAIVKELTGRDVPVLVDPTLMLSKEKWLQISKPAQYMPKNNYLLTYFLGDIDAEKRNWIKNLSMQNNLEIVRMADLEDEERYTADPGEFLDYIYNCTIFCTDSFHGAVFSILFEKPFVIFDRVSKTGSMSSRIDTLISKFKLKGRKWDKAVNTDSYFCVDYSHVPPILEDERNKAITYLRNALHIEDNE